MNWSKVGYYIKIQSWYGLVCEYYEIRFILSQIQKKKFLHSRKCWVKYNTVLGKIWTNPATGLFRPSGWVTAQKVGLNI